MDVKKIGFIGGGFIAEAIISGLTGRNFCPASNITVSDISDERLEYLRERYGVHMEKDNTRVAKESDVLILAVKPQVMPDVLKEISRFVWENRIIISVAAGVKISKMEALLKAKVVRTMPNICAQVGESATAVCVGRSVEKKDIEKVMEIFDCIGKTVLVREPQMDAVTGVSGSGPAYIFLVMEALIQAGVKEGLSPENSRDLVLQTVKGAAHLAIETGDAPEKLKQRIMSPNGTTVAALEVLDKSCMRNALLNGVAAAAGRSKELG
ncbi:MAG: pyrroline-5-carboxylate reductase [bacterium]|nr:MAG: pyrroline-5-carboxylate reductase [bacterium]